MHPFQKLLYNVTNGGITKDSWVFEHYSALRDDIQKAKARVEGLGRSFAGGEVVGILIGPNKNRLGYFHDEQSNSYFPVVQALSKISNGKLIMTCRNPPSPSSHPFGPNA